MLGVIVILVVFRCWRGRGRRGRGGVTDTSRDCRTIAMMMREKSGVGVSSSSRIPATNDWRGETRRDGCHLFIDISSCK